MTRLDERLAETLFREVKGLTGRQAVLKLLIVRCIAHTANLMELLLHKLPVCHRIHRQRNHFRMVQNAVHILYPLFALSG